MITVILLEPFYGGSHKQLMDWLTEALGKSTFDFDDADCTSKVEVLLYQLPAKKWHWRARCSALKLAQNVQVEECKNTAVLFCSSVLNLSEFLSLRPDLASKVSKTVVYFHENQLVYPVQTGSKKEERDFQYGYNQILTAMVADTVIFNSEFNKTSFIDNINSFFNQQPDCKPDTEQIRQKLESKSHVLHFPVSLLPIAPPLEQGDILVDLQCLHIVWPHRWEHDKNPESFFKVLFQLKDEGHQFKVSVLGESFSQIPAIFNEAKTMLAAEICQFGRLESKEDYHRLLASADVVVSTANHEFFGVAMVEGALAGCHPLAPNRLAYPEIFPKKCLYRTDQQLFKKLKDFCKKPHVPRQIWKPSEIAVKSAEQLKDDYVKLIMSNSK